ncbi:wd40 repeat-containing protein [Leptolyngbya sp. Heron Island J]|uniref:serine/threonine-protein kinase n=1 Tax=Leptolyngbya sp. Heron Island J TaxID=1385935 RepID=UPI0003B95CC6|nr:serine/threonine-protein kinase [Leptolyngbya sp. Heron Island J]ESA33763.1 wd40 repeat-containing protein [Leptolyngbya sp. Heron Island J]
MICCLNPDCLVPVNPDGVTVCQSCGSPLAELLRNRYRPIKPLGQGGFGKTYLAEDIDRLNTRCVIKQFARQASNKTFDKALTLFNQEAVRLNELGEHPQIPSLLAYFEQQGNFYLVQQEIKGNTLLQEVKKEGPFDEGKVRSLLHYLLPVLQFIHDRNVVHRDINPTNIISRQPDNKPVLIDFGIAKQLEVSLSDKKNHTGTRIGTEGYSPIEQLRSGEAYPSSDLYSLGATCICLMTGRKPEKLYSPLEGRWLWQEHLTAAGRPATPELAAILDRMLKDFINERYRSAAEVIQELEALPAYHRSVPGWTRQRPQDAGLMSDAISTGQDVSRNLSEQLINQEFDPQFGQEHPPTAPPNRSSGARPISQAKPGPGPAHPQSGPAPNRRRSGPVSKGQSKPFSGRKSGPVSKGQSRPISGRKSGPVSKGQSGPVSGIPSGPMSLGRPSTGSSLGSPSSRISGMTSSGMTSSGMTTRSQSSGPLSGPSHWVCTHTLEGHNSWVSAVAFNPKYMVLASGGLDDTVNLWDISTGTLTTSLTGHARGINGLAFSPRGQVLASCSDDDTIRVWNAGTGQLLHILKGHRHDVTSVAIGRRGSLLISGSEDRTVGVWNLEQGKLAKVLSGNAGMIRCVDISPDEELVVSGGFDNKIRLWQLGTGEVFRVLSGHLNSINDIAISADGRLIVSASKDRCIKLWSLRSGNLIHTLKGHTREINAVAIAPNQRTVVSAGGDSCIKVWDTKTGELVETFTDHGNSVTAIAIHPNGQYMASASSDKTIKLWHKE